MHSLTLKTQSLFLNSNQFKPFNQNSSNNHFNSLKCYPNSVTNFTNSSKPNSKNFPIIETHFPNQPNLIAKSSKINPIVETQVKSQSNLINFTKPSSKISPIVETHFQNQPNLINLTKPSSKNFPIVETHFSNQPNLILTKPGSKIDPIVETQFKNLSKSIVNLTKPRSQISKIQFLSSEFRALPEPIDRVKRLLYYADLLQPFDELGRVESNRVNGCTTQVWLEAKIDSEGLMRFKADSDSEITKGFCYCLIWALDGEAPEEVLAVVSEDLAEMNVGFSGKSKHSRVNTWQNVLVGMQRRTKGLVGAFAKTQSVVSFGTFGVRCCTSARVQNAHGSSQVMHMCQPSKSLVYQNSYIDSIVRFIQKERLLSPELEHKSR